MNMVEVILIIALYVIIGWIIGCICFVFYNHDIDDCMLMGVVWLGIPIVLIPKYITLFFIVFLTWIKNGCPFYIKKIEDCCGSCKYIRKSNNGKNIYHCKHIPDQHFFTWRFYKSSQCKKYKKNLFWRFKYKADK